LLTSAEKVYWYVREISTAVIVANMPHLWALARRTFNLRAFLSHGSASRSRLGTNNKPETLPQAGPTQVTDGRKWYGFKSKGSNPNSFLDQSGSEERIIGVPLEIRKDVEFRVERDTVTQDLDSDLEYAKANRLEPSRLHSSW
jgi:hypothetical protein